MTIYCFKILEFSNQYEQGQNFTIEQLKKWREEINEAKMNNGIIIEQ